MCCAAQARLSTHLLERCQQCVVRGLLLLLPLALTPRVGEALPQLGNRGGPGQKLLSNFVSELWDLADE